MISLPLEILHEIFKHAHRSVTFDEWNKVVLANLRVVCSEWYAAAETCPSLWTSILVTEKSALRPTSYYTESTLPEPYLLLPSTAAAFIRSGDRPLDIVIHFPYTPYRYPLRPDDGHYFSINHALVLSSLLNANSCRIASLEIHGETNAIKRNTLKYLSQRIMPLLYRFVDVGVTDTGLGRAWSYEFFTELDDYEGHRGVLQHPHCRTPPRLATVNAWGKTTYPALEELEICGTSYNWDLFPSIQGLRKLSLCNQPQVGREASSRSFLAMLTINAHTLQHLELTDVFHRNKHFGPFIVLSNLESLSIGYHLAHEPVWLLSVIRTPALRELSLVRDPHGHSSDSESVHSKMLKALVRSLPLSNVEKLTLKGVVFPTSSEYKVRVPAASDDLLPKVHAYWRELGVSQLPESAAKYTLFVFFLRQFPVLKHLSIDKAQGADLGHMGPSSLSVLEELHVEVVGRRLSDGFASFLNDVTEERRTARKALKVSVGKRLESALSEKGLWFDSTVRALATCGA